MIFAGVILLTIISIIAVSYVKKTVDTTAAIIYGIYALLVIALWILFVVSYLNIL